jgi:hypothetical protein
VRVREERLQPIGLIRPDLRGMPGLIVGFDDTYPRFRVRFRCLDSHRGWLPMIAAELERCAVTEEELALWMVDELSR